MPGFDIGAAATTAITNVKKVVDSTIVQGTSAITGAVNTAINNLNSNLTSAVGGLSNLGIPGVSNIPLIPSVEKVPMGIQGRLVNPLHYYSSYNYNFTLSVLDDASLNFPNETYKKGILGPILLKSGSGNPSNRFPTIYKSKNNPSGSFDFFLEDLVINHVIGFEKETANSNSIGMRFKIIEPYSMGIFFQSLQAAALATGNENYISVPLLLTIDFKGHLSADTQNVQIEGTTKHYPLKLRTINMKVNGQGSVYEVDAYPWNESAYSSVYSRLTTAISIKGASVVEMLQTGEHSLQRELNNVLQKKVEKGLITIPDQILISFPIDLKTGDAVSPSNVNSATVNPNSSSSSPDLFSKLKLKQNQQGVNTTQVQEEGTVNHIGLSNMGFSAIKSGDLPFSKDNLVYDETSKVYKRSDINLEIKPDESEFRFGQGSDIINAINQVILMSEYGRSALKQISSDGFVPWWRIETHVYHIPTDANISKTGIKPKLIVYRVVPYSANAAEFQPVNSGSIGIAEDKKQVLKEYNYIYSGKNTDIVDFNIEFNAGFYTALSADSGANNIGVQMQKQASDAAEDDKKKKNETNVGGTVGAVPGQSHFSKIVNPLSNQGGGGLEDAVSIAARQFFGVVTSGTNMITLDLTILGDPYYLGDSGVGNYSAVAGDNRYITADNAMNYQSGEVHVLVNFRTPIDIDLSTGVFDFADSYEVPQFSGLYRVLKAESNFSRGRFVQTLNLIRLPNQENDPTTEALLAMSPEEIDVDKFNQQAIEDLEAAVKEQGITGSSITDEQAAANRAALGNFEG